MAALFITLGLCCLVGGIILSVDGSIKWLLLSLAGIIIVVLATADIEKKKTKALERAEVFQSVVKRADLRCDEVYILLENGEILSEKYENSRFLIRKGDVITYKKTKEYADIIEIEYVDDEEVEGVVVNAPV